nr:zinc knuckle CX2CX4HX4C [Tanacetum cinerariifolium]
MMNSKGFFFYQFKTAKGLEDVLEIRPWMIRNSPIILKKWTMNTRLCKDELTCIPVWVKIHDVPIQAFSEDGLSIIVSNIGKPIILDSYTSSMCIESRGRSSFARCLIEINAKDVLPESLTIVVPLIENTGFTIKTATVEYEWKPPRCDLYKIFGHIHDHCPNKESISPIVATFNIVTSTAATSNVVTPTVEKTNDGFQTMEKKEDEYEPKATTSAPKKGTTNVGNAKSMLKTTITSIKKDNIATSNPYFALEDESDEDVENVYDELDNLFQSIKTGESSSTFTVVVATATAAGVFNPSVDFTSPHDGDNHESYCHEKGSKVDMLWRNMNSKTVDKMLVNVKLFVVSIVKQCFEKRIESLFKVTRV